MSAAPKGLYLHAPGLFGSLPPGAAELLAPDRGVYLAALLRRAVPRRRGALCDFLGTGSHRHNAALAAHGAGLGGPGEYWMHAAPLHLVPDRDTLMVQGPEALSLSRGEAEALVGELNSFFGDNGLHFHAREAEGWLVQVSDPASVPDCPPLEAVRGRRLSDCLPEGGRIREWMRLLNEAQMLLHASETSRSREAGGLPRVNGVWLWGGGVLPATTAIPWQSLAGDDPGLRGLARVAGLPWIDPRTGAVELARRAAAGEAVLLSLQAAPPVTDGGSFQAWQDWLGELEAEWLAPLHQALRHDGLPRIVIGGEDLEWHCGARDPLRFWRRPRPLRALLERSG